MSNRWFNLVVVLLWLASMSWLVTMKVLPTLMVGDPPSYRTILDAQKCEPPVGWKIVVNRESVGWALTTIPPSSDGQTLIRSRVHFDRVPLEEIAPDWLRPLLRLVEKPAASLRMDSVSDVVIGSDGRLAGFNSTVRVEPLGHTIHLDGKVVGGRIELSVQSGSLTYFTEAYLPPDAVVGNSLAPQTQLPGLQLAQTWTAPAYSLLRPPSSPMEILQAKVEDVDTIMWNGRAAETLVVVYRDDPGGGFRSDNAPRGKLWVRSDGTVLKQQMLSSMMTFTRLSEAEAEAVAREQGIKQSNQGVE